jgi:hypothetical protein
VELCILHNQRRENSGHFIHCLDEQITISF